ncbi:intestinal mucin-like protein [Centroberyx affinis]|uniref:intestinal mucin-like protein n=1 Tax=Centroberyx affinis TaxID=166261 RepID=UPI003A5C3398
MKTLGQSVNVVYVNQKRIYPAYSNSVLRLTSTDMVITLEILEIKAEVVYRGSSFRIDLPYSLFSSNTEGQCGTCDNSQANDCRSPNGQVENCTVSAGQWHVPGTPCVTPTVPPTTTITAPPFSTTVRTSSAPPISTPAPCKPAICDILTSSVFDQCRTVVPPAPFVEACRSDICNGGNDSCSSLQAYASECSSAGVCIDWRNATNGQCEHKCPSNKVYMACGPAVEPTCNDRYNKKFQAVNQPSTNSSNTKEGCFCPHETTLFNTVYDVCVVSCDCVGPDGKPKQPGDTWVSGCNHCMCDKDSMGIQCHPITCPPTPSLNCSKPGQRLLNKTEDCCPAQSCECDVNLCPTDTITCQPGFQLNMTMTSGSCCLSYQCVPKGVCVHSKTEYPPGSKIPPSGPESCEDCYCSSSINSSTKLHTITCTPVVCNKTCSKGYEYQTVPGQCCGKCVQKICIVNMPDNTTNTIEVNKTWSPPDDKCVKYTCEKINGQLITKETKITCPHFNPLDCEPGTETTDSSGCCKTCTVRSICEVQSKQTVIKVNDCTSLQPVNISSCAGHCGSSSMYSAAANMMMHQCECCQEKSTSQKEVELTCPDGSRVKHTYITVEACSCSVTKCAPGVTPSRRRRR